MTATIIGGLFLALAYSSSAQVFAADNSYIMSCSYTKDKKTSFCSDNDPSNNDVWRCDKQKNGTWKCGKIPRESGGSLPTDLKKALDLATENAVNVTSTSPDFLSKKKELLNNDNEITREESTNSSLE